MDAAILLLLLPKSYGVKANSPGEWFTQGLFALELKNNKLRENSNVLYWTRNQLPSGLGETLYLTLNSRPSLHFRRSSLCLPRLFPLCTALKRQSQQKLCVVTR